MHVSSPQLQKQKQSFCLMRDWLGEFFFFFNSLAALWECGILVPQPGQWKHGVLTTEPPGKCPRKGKILIGEAGYFSGLGYLYDK